MRVLTPVVRYQNQLLLLVLSLVAFAPSFWLGHIPGDSSKYNVAWLAEFSDSLFSGVLYPRWLPNMNAGLGGADFYFYGPLPFYLGAPITLIASEKMAVVLLSWFMCLMSGLAMYRFARAHVGLHGGTLAAILYMIAPYHLILAIMTRNVIGEQAAFIFMPLTLAFADQLGKSPRTVIWLALSFAALTYSHLATTLLFSPLLVAYCLLRVAKNRDARILAEAVCAGVLGVVMTAAYVLPALTLDAMIFPSFWDVLRPDENFLFAEPGELARRIPNFRLLLHLVAGTLIAVTLALMLYLALTRRRAPLRLWGASAVLYILLNFEISAPIWNAVDLFDRVQFPWRSLTVIELCAAMIAAYAIGPFSRRLTLMISALLIVLSAGVISLGLMTYDRLQIMAYSEAVEDVAIAKRWGPLEYRPSCIAQDRLKAVNDYILQKSATTEDAHSKFAFDFLVGADGQELSCDPQTGLIQDYDAVKPVRVDRPAVEVWGNALTLLALAISVVGLIALRRRRA